MLSVEDWAEIRRLHRAEGMPIKAIARVLGCLEEHGAGGVGVGGAAAVSSGRPAGSIVDEVEPRIRELLQAYPSDAGDGDRGADRLGRGRSGAQGPGGASCGRCICRRIRPSRTSYGPGEIAQCDLWFPPIEMPVGFGQVRTADAAAGADDGDAGTRGGCRR